MDLVTRWPVFSKTDGHFLIAHYSLVCMLRFSVGFPQLLFIPSTLPQQRSLCPVEGISGESSVKERLERRGLFLRTPLHHVTLSRQLVKPWLSTVITLLEEGVDRRRNVCIRNPKYVVLVKCSDLGG